MAKQFQSAGRSETGKVRRRNEDAILLRDDAGLWAVADGLGGHAAGDHASGLIVQRLGMLVRAGDDLDFIGSIEDALAATNAELRDEARARGVDLIASTVVLLVRATGCWLCGWVGDSRAYCSTGGELRLLTRDHVYAGVDGSVPAVGSGVLTRAVGADAILTVDWTIVADAPGSTYVLCSDGVNKELSDNEIAAACGQRSAAAVLDEVFSMALGRAARDNVSAVIVRSRGGSVALPNLDAVNRELNSLDQAHHAGTLGLAAYRERRRQLLAGCGSTFGAVVETGSIGQDRGRWLAWLRGLFGGA